MRRRGALCAALAALLAACLEVLIRPPIAMGAPRVSAGSAILIEQSTGQRLYGVKPDLERPIASTTKLMTALLTLEHARLERVFAQNTYSVASTASQIGLNPGERMTVHDLLIALLLPSANDAAEDLAFNVGGRSVARFLGMMNARARQLGLVHTHYSTPSGLDTPGNYSSASDLVRLASFLLTHHPFFARVVALPKAVLRSGDRVRFVSNRNDLVGTVPWVTGVKTGNTRDAGYVLVGSGTRSGMTLLSAVLGTSSTSARDADTLALLDYGFSSFRLATPVRAGTVLARPTVRDRPGVHANVIASATFTRVVSRRTSLTVRVEVPRQLAGPLKRDAVVGQVIVLANGRPIGRTPLRLAQPLPAVSALAVATRFFTRTSTLSLLALLVAVAVLVVLRRERARSARAADPETA